LVIVETNMTSNHTKTRCDRRSALDSWLNFIDVTPAENDCDNTRFFPVRETQIGVRDTQNHSSQTFDQSPQYLYQSRGSALPMGSFHST